jgi:YYY domain-containing protein
MNETRPNKPNIFLMSILLLLVLLIGGYFRFTGLNWDDFSALHPDERFLTLNLLPLIGGQLEFTPDNERFPSYSLVTSATNPIASSYDFQLNPVLKIGTGRGSFSEELGILWLDEDRVLAFDTPGDAYQALLAGTINAILIDDAQAQTLQNADTRILETWDSVQVQQIRCAGLYPQTNGVGGYFDSYCSSLNPHNAGAGFYAYGTLPLLMAHYASEIVRSFSVGEGAFLSFPGGPVVWRFLSAFFDMGSILLLFFIGSRLHNRWVGLIAAFLYACAPLAIAKAHYGTVNAITAFFVMLAIWAAVQVQDKGRLGYFAVFGIALGAALAGRINIVPLAGVVVLAAMMNAAPVLDSRIAWAERERLLWRNGLGIMLAGMVTLIAFRIFNPYAFVGDGFFGLIPNPRFLADAQSASFGVSGASDAPPNWQWLGRISYFYPLKDMLLWGMGIAMGVMAWLGFGWSGYRLLRGREFATRNILLFAWVFVYFAWIGRLWVMTMRYFLPLYGSLALLAAWAIYELYRQSVQREGQDLPLTRVLLISFGVIFAIVPAYYAYSGLELTATAMSSGVLAVFLIAAAIVPILPRRSFFLAAFVTGFTLLWGLMFSNIYHHQLTRVQAARWAWENVSGDFSMQIEGDPEGTPLINIALGNRSYDSATSPSGLLPAATRIELGSPYFVDFVAPASGTISQIHSPHLADPLDDADIEMLYISISQGSVLLSEIVLNQDMTRDNHPLGDSYEMLLDTPLEVLEGESYLIKIEAIAGPIVVSGEVMVNEGSWDDRITQASICNLPNGLSYADDPAPGLATYENCNSRASMYALHQSYDLAMSYPVDEQLKYENMVDGLDVGDYLAITSNRFYDTETRNPARWPMTTAYYRALFNGELGYELVASFSESYELGFLSVDDQHLPIYDSPAWLNELESDEAFNVYDHPTVFIFRKTADYDPAMVRSILNYPMLRAEQIGFSSLDTQAQIVDVVYWDSLTADRAPTALQQPYDRLSANTAGGTWSGRFDSASILNTNQALGVVVWWLLLVAIGLLTWPLLFAAFPNLGDRGYGFAKIVGLLLLGWIAWFGANFTLPLWSQGGLLLILLFLAGLSAYIAFSRRAALREYLAEYWVRIVSIEVMSLILFAIFIAVRLSNPDLWHHPMGGEKPMDFAYFNAVLRTTVFPAYNPWASGEFINYYYFGYVIVGVPTLLLRIVPAFAYNLIVPSLFAITGVGAFSAAFNIVDAWTSRNLEIIDEKHYSVIRRMGNPWIAGVSALLLCVVLGNLDTPRVLIEEGIARLGGYERPTGLEGYLIKQYVNEHGVMPDEMALLDIQERAAANYLTDNIAYELSIRGELFSSFVAGLGRSLAGETMPLGSNRWYWGPTRTIQETPDVGGYAINELPYFTFLYADLHAHMISMPLMLFVIAFVFYEVQQAKSDERSLFAQFLALFFGALAVGMLRAINTWDWPTFMLFVLLGLAYAWWLRWGKISRASLSYFAIHAGGFVAIAGFVVVPYTAWFASSYESILPWTGGKTPLWAYWNIHGLFIFLLVSLLIWDTARYLRETHVRDIAGRGSWLMIGVSVIIALLLGAFAAALIEYQVALIVVPLIIWIALLFFRPNQALPMQFVLVLAGLALCLTMGVEVIVLDGDIGRQNTVFKFYIQAWMLFSVMGGAAFAWIVQQADNWRFRLQVLWFTPLMILIAAAAMFPFAATRARTIDRFVPELAPTLNGLDYMQQASYYTPDNGIVISLANDYALIRWLQENVEGSPVVLEGRFAASEYHYNGRISINTGLPTILGWNWHQRQQHTLSPLSQIVQQREYNIQYAYNSEDIPSVVNILSYYNVRYIIVSDMEIAIYPAAGLDKFNRMVEMGLLTIAYQANTGLIYEVNQAGLDSFTANQFAFNQAIGLVESLLPPSMPDMGMSELAVNTDADVSMVLPVLAEREMDFLVLTNPPRVIHYTPEVYDRFATLETLGILEIIDNSDARRTYRINHEALNSVMGEN